MIKKTIKIKYVVKIVIKISDTTRLFQGEIDLRNRQNNSNLDTQFDNYVELIVNENT